MKRSIEEVNFLKGQMAFLIGWKIEDCGFKEGPEKVQWLKGFCEAKAEAEAKKEAKA
jgi:ribosome modulation factor